MSIDNLPPMDIISFINTVVILTAVGVLVLFWMGIRAIQESRQIAYYRLKQEKLITGWRTILYGFLLVIFTFWLNRFGPPTASKIFTMTATPTLTSTSTPTLDPESLYTQTPTLVVTLDKTYTPTITATPHVPLAIEAQFTGIITPPASVAFSPLVFGQGIDANYQPINPNTFYLNPVGHMYAWFSYNQMVNGIQWTAIWLYEGELVFFETLVWAGGGGGYGYSDYNPEPEEWSPGIYQVQIFAGTVLQTVGEFEVSGQPPTSTPTLTYTPSPSMTPTTTSTPTETPSPTLASTEEIP